MAYTYSLQRSKVAMAVAFACEQIGHEYRSAQMLKRQLSREATTTGRISSTQPAYQELPKG